MNIRKVAAQTIKELIVDFKGIRMSSTHIAKKHGVNQASIIGHDSAHLQTIQFFMEEIAKKTIPISFQLSFDTIEDKEFAKQMFEIQALFVLIFGQ
jgi:hypothetical protein